MSPSQSFLAVLALCVADSWPVDDPLTFMAILGEGPRLHATAGYPVLGSSPVRQLASRTIEREVKAAMDEITRIANGPAPPGRTYKNELDWDVYLGVDFPNLVSFRTHHFEYTGGAHPNTYQRTYNFGLVAGKPKRLILRDVLRKDVPPLEWANTYVLRRLNQMKEDRRMDPFGYLDARLVNSFYITEKGLVWVFEHYAVGPYSEGPYEIEVQWPALKDAIDPNGPAGRFIK